MDYDERGNVRTFTTGNGAGSTFTYDDRGLVESISVGTADGKEILDVELKPKDSWKRSNVKRQLKNYKKAGAWIIIRASY